MSSQMSGPLPGPGSPEPPLPVNSKTLSDKPHMILRLDQIQRAVLEDPSRFDQLEGDRSLNHVRKDVRKLQEALMKAIKKELEDEKLKLQRAGELLSSWAGESELKDVLTLDAYKRQNLMDRAGNSEGYGGHRDMIEQFRHERERIFNKYRGFFDGQQTDMDNRKSDTQKKLKPIGPKMDEWRARRDRVVEQQQAINYYYQQSTHYLVIGLASMIALTGVGAFAPVWGGWLWGMIMGSTIFSYLASRFAYVSGQPMEDLHAFLLERMPAKNVKPFFRYEDKEDATKPTRFDASRGDLLSQILQKEVLAAGSEFSQLERQREEHLSYLQYLEGRKQWAAEQIRRIDAFENRPPEAPKPEPVVLSEIPSGTGELSKIPPLPEEIPPPEPDKAEGAEIAVPVGIPTIEPKAIAGRKVRPASRRESPPLPDRAS